MSKYFLPSRTPKILPPLDNEFSPAVLWNRNYLEVVRNSKDENSISIAVERDKDSVMVYHTQIFSDKSRFELANYYYIEQLVKTLLWIYGGHKIYIGGSKKIGEYIKKTYSSVGKRSFDINIMSKIFEEPFIVEICDIEKIPSKKDKSVPVGRHLEGCRIGFDLGASDRKVSAVIDGKAVFTEEVLWNPCEQADPSYHYHEIMSMLHRAAIHMPRVDAIGGSSAGIYINNRVMIASLFRAVPVQIFEERVKNIFLTIQEKWKVPLEIINDGEVTALAGSMFLKKNSVLGIAMGSSEAGGYVNSKGNINSWLNELAFIPVDFNLKAPADEWSGDKGCGVQYFSQQAVIRLAKKAGIIFDSKLIPAEKLKSTQNLMLKGDNRVREIFETIGCYLGYTIAHYTDFYEIENILILGRVTSGEGGKIILKKAQEVLNEEFPELSKKVTLHLPGEANRRVGQSIAAASLPLIKN